MNTVDGQTTVITWTNAPYQFRTIEIKIYKSLHTLYKFITHLDSNT